jgi:hypothetical protein
MSYSYGPTVVYPAFTMGEPFGSSSYDAKENYAALQGMHLSSVKVCLLPGLLGHPKRPSESP